jgi:hypothetical protein
MHPKVHAKMLCSLKENAIDEDISPRL